MKRIQLAVLLALAGAGLCAPHAQAQTLTYNQGDVLIGFRSTSNSTFDYLVDAGPVSNYLLNDGSSFTLNIGSTGSDLAGALDSTWSTDGTVRWGIAAYTKTGAGATANTTLFASQVETTTGTVGAADYAPTVASTFGGDGTTVNTVGTEWATEQPYSSGSSGVQQLHSDLVSYVNAGTPNGNAYGYFASVDFEGAINTNTNHGVSLDFYQITNTNHPGPGAATYEGTFTISGTGTITYQSANSPSEPVPEPSALTALAAGVGLLGLIRRRHVAGA